jgi:short-subunit dehydrogenase
MGLPTPSPDRTVVVTGASSGIGEEIARELARRGHGLVLVARREQRLRELADSLADRGVRIEIAPLDLSDREARSTLPDLVADWGLEADVLVNNAGLSTSGPVHRSTPEAEMHMVEVDVVAVADLTTRMLPAMVERGRGGVLNVASTAAFQPLPGQAGYGACKAFVLSYTRSLSGELRGTGVTATALCPGPVLTEFGEIAGFDESAADSTLPDFVWTEADDVARAGIDAFARGRQVVIPGTANRITAAAATLTPKDLLVPVLARIHPALRDAGPTDPGPGDPGQGNPGHRA